MYEKNNLRRKLFRNAKNCKSFSVPIFSVVSRVGYCWSSKLQKDPIQPTKPSNHSLQAAWSFELRPNLPPSILPFLF